jgi:hypothetical protein
MWLSARCEPYVLRWACRIECYSRRVDSRCFATVKTVRELFTETHFTVFSVTFLHHSQRSPTVPAWAAFPTEPERGSCRSHRRHRPCRTGLASASPVVEESFFSPHVQVRQFEVANNWLVDLPLKTLAFRFLLPLDYFIISPTCRMPLDYFILSPTCRMFEVL